MIKLNENQCGNIFVGVSGRLGGSEGKPGWRQDEEARISDNMNMASSEEAECSLADATDATHRGWFGVGRPLLLL